MITEDYCSQEVAKLLKAKGFPAGVGSWSKGFIWDGEGYVPGLVKHENSITHQMAMKWLREIYNIIIMIDYNEDEDYEDNERFGFTIYQKNIRKVDLATYPTYEEAVEAAILYVLNKVL